MFIINSLEEYVRCWTKSEGEETDTLSEWIKSIRKLPVLNICIHHLSDKAILALTTDNPVYLISTIGRTVGLTRQ
jgi:hypothetical protein